MKKVAHRFGILRRALMAGILLLTCMAAGAQDIEYYPLWLGDTQVTDENYGDILGDGKASFVPAYNILTLGNPTISGVHTFGENNEKTAVIYYDGNSPLTIEGMYHQTSATAQYGIMVCNDLNLQESESFTFCGTEEAIYCTCLSIDNDDIPIGATYNSPHFYSPDGSFAKQVEFNKGTAYNLWLGYTQVTSANQNDIFGDSKSTYFPDKNELVLYDPTITGVHRFGENNEKTALIYYNGDTCFFISGFCDQAPANADYGIMVCTDLSITPEGGDLAFCGTECGVYAQGIDISYHIIKDVTFIAPYFYDADGTVAKYVKVSRADNYYGLFLGNTSVNSFNKDDILGDGTASFNPETNTLTLNNPTIPGAYYYDFLGGSKIFVTSKNIGYITNPIWNLTIKGSYHMSEVETSLGVYMDGGNTLSFDGNFIFNGINYGIYGPEITVKSGSLTAIGNEGKGIVSESLAIEDGVDYVELGGEPALNLHDGAGLHLADGYMITSPKNGIFQNNVIYHPDNTTIAKDAVISSATSPVVFYDLWVGSRHVTSKNKDDILGDGKASFDPTSNTLTLNNPTIPGNTHYSKIYTYLPSIKITGSYHMTEAETSSGIRSDNALTLDGDFTILSAGFWYGKGNPIWAAGDINLGGNITVQGQNIKNGAICTETGNITITRGNIHAQSTECGVYCGGTFTAKGGAESIVLEGKPAAIYAGNVVIDNATGQYLYCSEPINAYYFAKYKTIYSVNGNRGTLASRVVFRQPRQYNLWLGETRVNDDNLDDILGDGKAKYDPVSQLLTLDNPTISGYTFNNGFNNKISAEGIDLTIKGVYRMDAVENSVEVGLAVKDGTLTCDGDFTFHGASIGVRVTDDVSVKGRLRALGDANTGILYWGTEEGKGLTLVPGFIGDTKVEMDGGLTAITTTQQIYHIGQTGLVLSEPVGGSITNYYYRIQDSNNEDAKRAVLTLGGTAMNDGTEQTPYFIHNDVEWIKACQDVANGVDLSGKYVALVGNVTARTMMGTEANPFNGTFDGRNHMFTLTANLNDMDASGCAPFQYISGATIKNVKVNGSVTGGMDCAGLVGYVSGGTNLIQNCQVSTTVSTYLSNCGGVVGNAGSATTTLSGTAFDGSIIGTTRGSSGSGNGLNINIGGAWNSATLVGRSNNDATITLTGCLDLSDSDQPIGQGTANLTVTNTYYTKAGKKNTDIDSWSGLAKYAYHVKGLDVELSLTGATGATWNQAIYAAQNENVSFSVIPNSKIYTSTAGTITRNGGIYTLVMPAENVTILDQNASSFDIATNIGANGSVTVASSSRVGAAVFMSITPDTYYLLDELTVKDADDNELEIKEESQYHYFYMPNKAVTISATFKKKYDYNATTGELKLLYGEYNNLVNCSWGNDVPKASVKKVTASEGVRFTKSCGGLFSYFSNCKEMDLSNVNTSELRSTANMFGNCEKLETLNLTGWATSQIVDMSDMFNSCDLLGELDLSGFNVSEGTDLKNMFEGCDVYKLTLPAGMAVTTDMSLVNGTPDNNWNYSGWTLLGSGGTVVSGTGGYAQIMATPVPMTIVKKVMPDNFVLELPDDVDNTETVELWDGVTTNVKLTGRTLYKDGKWNTLCVPFHLGSLEVLNNFGNNVEIMGLETLWQFNENGEAYYGNPSEPEAATFPYKTGYDYMTGTLRLYYLWSDDIYAGTPYILKWANGDNIISPVFENVTIDKTICPVTSNDGKVTFAGTYAPIANTEGILFDSHNTSNKAFQAALQIEEPTYANHFFAGWYNDAEFTNPTTTMPFADDGTVKLYARFLESTANVTFAKEGFSTYYNSLADAVLPTGMKARIITAKGDGSTLTYQTVADGSTQDNIVPAGTAVMLQVAPSDAAQTIDLSLTAPAASAISQNNMLYGSDASTTTTGGGAGAKYYKLSYSTSGQDLGWYWGANNGAAFQSGAHKAWLALPSSGQNSASRFVALPNYYDNTTDVLFIPYPVAEQEGAWYLIDGTKLNNTPTAPGLYIHNGQTIMIER